MSVLVKHEGETARITLNRPERRNALAEDMLQDLLEALRGVGGSDASGIVLAAEGPVFCSGHDFADVHGRDHASSRELLVLCTSVMRAVQTAPQVVVARVQGLATAAGCQLVASCDLAVAAESAGFALPGGKAGWFCHTPAVAVARNISRKHLMEMALTGADGGAVGAGQLHRARRATRHRRGAAAGPSDQGQSLVQGAGQADFAGAAGPTGGRRVRTGDRGDGRGLADG